MQTEMMILKKLHAIKLGIADKVKYKSQENTHV